MARELVFALACSLVACALPPRVPSPAVQGLLASARDAPHLSRVLDTLLEELASGNHRNHLLGTDPRSFDNPCKGAKNLDLVPPFVCLVELPLVAFQWLPQHSLAWVLDHSHPEALLGIVFLASVTGDVIPEKIGEFHNLLALHVSSVSAPLPAALSQLTKLQVFDVMKVQGGPIEMPQFDLMPDLQGIQLGNVEGGTRGAWPTFANHTQLSSVRLPKAGIKTPPPDRLFQLPSLLALNLEYNPVFNGPLPENISTSVDHLQLARTGATGTIPASFAQLSLLTHLYLFGNQLTGTIPSQFGLTTRLDELRLDQNRLSGTIPSWLGRLTALEALDVSNNLLQGTLPSELGLLTSLQELSFYENRVSGTLPVELQHLTALTTLLVDTNRLTGPVFCLPSAETIRCADNYLTNKPPDQCQDEWTANCDLSGLDDPRCEQRETKCDPWDKQYAVFGEGCVHLSLLVPVPASAVFVFVLGVFLWSFRKEKKKLVDCWVLGWSAVAATVAALEFASSWATLLVFNFDLPSPLGPAACCVYVVALLLHGATGCVLCPSKSDLRVPAVLTILLARQLLVEVPWRVVFARHGRRGREANNNNNDDDHHQGQGMTSPGDSAGQLSRVAPPQQPATEASEVMLRFTRRAAFVQVVVNAAVFGCQVALWYHHKASHLVGLARILGGACLFVSVMLFVAHRWNEKRHQPRSHQA